MKRILFLFISVILLFLTISCEENISPKGETPQKYSVNLILRGDTTFQTAYISRLYDVEGFDPYIKKDDPAVTGASVSIKYTDSNKRYFFRDTVDNDNLNSRYSTPARYYYIKNFRPAYGKEIELNIILPEGQQLSSKTKISEGIYFDEIKTLPYIPGPFVDRDTVYINVVWENSGLDIVKAKKVYFDYYYKELSGQKTKFTKQVPIKISDFEGIVNADYNNVSYRNDLKISRKILEQALEEISAGNSAKGRYSIAPLIVEVILYDENLSKYFAADLFFDYGFTIRSYPADITNINGGLGFFGSYSSTKRIIKFDPQYLLKRFGYLSAY